MGEYISDEESNTPDTPSSGDRKLYPESDGWYDLDDQGNRERIGGTGTATTIDDTDSPYTTQNEDVIYCDTSSGAVTVTLASADATLANDIRIVNIDATNAVTVNTEGSETIDPDADSSKTIANAGWAVVFVSDGTNWDTDLAADFDSLQTKQADITNESLVRAILSSDQSLTAGSRVTAELDNVLVDERGEYDAVNFEFTPDSTGWYFIAVQGRFNIGADGDRCEVQFRNVPNDEAELWVRNQAGGAGIMSLASNSVVELTGGEAYDMRVANFDSNDTLKSDGSSASVPARSTTFVAIRSVFR